MTKEATGFLYPFIEEEERDPSSLLTALAQSAGVKALETAALSQESLAAYGKELKVIAQQMADRFRAGGRLFAFGNGGSATDAAGLAALFAEPPHGVGLPARSLVQDEAIVTALGNDVGFELVFSRQLIAYARAHDIAVGYSTSGNSDNVIRAFKEANSRGLLTIGFAGYEGGAMAACSELDHCLVVRSSSVHRIQESQSALSYALFELVQVAIGGAPSSGTPRSGAEASGAVSQDSSSVGAGHPRSAGAGGGEGLGGEARR